ncbi:hypothetical protein CDAR_381841 [Caerostris darwini]|uniref:Uncharacterized protein n=1 Tax=Caerostris darwini TaxID=1538125 RepID=A0AAV4V4T6_9ARAC|nr:hypothetical protein CDAR_381841 [Caerostris darwini]
MESNQILKYTDFDDTESANNLFSTLPSNYINEHHDCNNILMTKGFFMIIACNIPANRLDLRRELSLIRINFVAPTLCTWTNKLQLLTGMEIRLS